MKVVVSSRVKVHTSARDRFTDWSRLHGPSYASLKAELEAAQGQPAGAMPLGNGRWIWASGGTFVSYVLKDKPVAAFGPAASLPVLVDRFIIVTDIFAV